MKKTLLPEKTSRLAKFLRVAGDENRIRIMCLLFKRKKICVSDIAEELSISVAISSHHLQELLKAGIVLSERNGKEICYFLAKSALVSDFKKFICKYK